MVSVLAFLSSVALANPSGLTDVDLKSLADAVAPELAKCSATAYHFEIKNKTAEHVDKTKLGELLSVASGKSDQGSAPVLNVELLATYTDGKGLRRGKYTLTVTGAGCTSEARMSKVTRK